jgi:HD superfamily phosphohydrolase/nucleoside 2-deoxyribosyltransferase
MLRRIEEPIIYFAGPEVFNTNRDDQATAEEWGKRHGYRILHPARHSHIKDQTEIYKRCCEDTRDCDVIVADLNNFRGRCMDDGTAIELGMAQRSGAAILGYKEGKEDPIARHGPPRLKGNLHVDENGYFIEEASDRNLMIMQSLDDVFYGPREQTLERIAQHINTKVKGWQRHEDPLLGRKLLPPDATEVYETIAPNYVVDLTRFKAIIEHPMMRRHREVKQLGALFWEYPDATHTRYTHSVLTFKFTYDMLRHFRLSEEEKRHALAYALLHDIGHTPYSHELEEITKLDQMAAAIEIIGEKSFRDALAECDIDLETMLTFFRKENPLRQIVSDKVLGTDKLSYLLRDGIATGKGGYDNIQLLIEHAVFHNGILGIDEKAAESALKQIQLYHTTYANTYYQPSTRLSQRIFTLLGQIGMDAGVLPENWHRLNDLWYDHFNIQAEQTGNLQLKKLGAEGIVKKAYSCIGSLRLKGAEVLEESGIHLDNITEEEYARFLAIPVRKRKGIEEELCKEAGVEPLGILVASGGDFNRFKIADTLVFRRQGAPVKLLEDMHPDIKQALEHEERKQAVSLRIYTRTECKEKVTAQLPRLIQKIRELIAA